MGEWFYQIKMRKPDAEYDPEEFWATPWAWPPTFSGKVTADNKDGARKMVDEEFGRKFPMRVAEKDMANSPFLLNIRQIKENDTRTAQLFELMQCKNCGAGFHIIDHYNNHQQQYKGSEYCCDECQRDYQERAKSERMFSEAGNMGQHPPVIYRITNNITNMAYIGQTTQAFTLRWWQHFFHGNDCKFHAAIKESKLTDWSWHILEVINLKEKPDDVNARDFISAREQFWIDKFDTIAKGYNTATAKVIVTAPLLEGLENG